MISIALGSLLICGAGAALIFLAYQAWRKTMASQQQLTDAVNALTPAVIAATTAVNTLIAAHGTVPDVVVQQITDAGTAINAITQAATTAASA